GAFENNDWYDVAKRDKGKTNALPLGFEVTGPADGIINWTTTTGLNGEWIVLVKQAKIVVLYLFKNLSETKEGSVNLNNLPANAGDWSHVSLISRGGTPPDEIPAPATLLLMGAGLATIGMLRRRRRAA
ncbi:MAG: PEP-CTERM sorting domain-containing protein, partial [Halioglobus sp.]